MSSLVLTKHHSCGNDFLVLVDPSRSREFDEYLARRLCDRHRGIGADGLLRASGGKGGTDVTMELLNADGSPAEMSGNGIACLVQAAWDAGLVTGTTVTVATDAGRRTVEIEPPIEKVPGVRVVTVDMGTPLVVGEKDVDGATGVLVDVGNPHLVLLDTGQDLVAVGEAYSDLNVELIAVPDADANLISLRVHERGVGPTLACGTGAVAAAVAARHLGVMSHDRVAIAQPGGIAGVEINSAGAARLRGRVECIARIEVTQ